MALAAEDKTNIFDGKPKIIVVNGYSTSFRWPAILQRKLDRYCDGKRLIEVRSATKGGTPIAKWIDVQTGQPREPWSIVRQALKPADETTPVIVLAQQSLQWVYGERTEGIRSQDDQERIQQGRDALEKYARMLLRDGADLVFIAMHIYKHPMEPEIGNERYALEELLQRKIPGVAPGPDVWTPTKRLYPQVFARDLVHPNSIGAEVMAQKWFEALLKYDGLEVPAWSKEEMRMAIQSQTPKEGQEKNTDQLRPSDAKRPGAEIPPNVRVLRDLEYARVGEKSLLLDIYLPVGAEESLPVIVWIHGGAWRGGDKRSCRFLGMAERGYAVLSINYRLSTEAIFPAQIHDCKAAIRWIRANAAKYNFDPERIGVGGSSAGGHLAALLGTTGEVKELEGDLGNLEHSSQVQAVCDWFGPTDFLEMDKAIGGRGPSDAEHPQDAKHRMRHDAADSPESQLIGGPIQENQEKVAAADPITYITEEKTLPPFLIMHGDQDFVVPLGQSELLYEALKKVGADVEFHIVKGAGHGFRGAEVDMGELEKMVAKFFDKHLKPGSALLQPARPERRRRVPGRVEPGPVVWVNLPDTPLPPGVKHETFHSKSMDRDVGYLIYLPPDYASGNKRYPVIYWLHGIQGTESRFPQLTQKLAQSIAQKKVPPMIMVLPNGGQRTFYCDSVDGKIMSETAIIKELIPHIDANYRTIASREGRALEGFSMGGFGAVHLAFKYPEVFSSMAAGAGALFDLERISSGHSEMYKTMFNEDPEAFKAQDPFELARKNAQAIRGKLQVLLFVGTEDMMYKYNENFRALLDELNIPYEYLTLEGVGHNRIACYEAFFDRIMAFHLKVLSPPVESQPASSQAKKRPLQTMWVNPPKEKLPGVEHRTFHSEAMQCDVGFNIYLPPDYNKETSRYPVLYYLHGLSGDESKHILLSAHLDKAIAEKKLPPMLMVFVNGGKGTMYSDSVDSKIMSETALIKELIPFVDENYRTVTSARGRAIEGFSMGGFGALKLAFKSPDMFCSVISYGGALHDLESFSTRRQERYEQTFGGRPEAFQANSPYELARKKTNEIRQNLQIRIVAGSEDMTLGRNENFRSLLDELEIPYEWELVEGVRHNIYRYYEEVGLKGLQFHCQRLSSQKPRTTNDA